MSLHLVFIFFFFSVFLFVLFHFYFSRLSFRQVSDYIQSRYAKLEEQLHFGMDSLSDVSVSMFVDVKKYEYLRGQLSLLFDRFELKKKELKEELEQLNQLQSRFYQQKKEIRHFIKKNDETIKVVAKSENDIELLKKSLFDMARSIEGFGKEKEKELEALFEKRMKKINFALAEQEKNTIKKINVIEDELKLKKDKILSVEENLIRASAERYRDLISNLEVEIGETIDAQTKKIDERILSLEHLSKDRLHVFHAQFDTTVEKQGQLEEKYQKLEKDIEVHKQSLREKMNELADEIVDDFKSKVENFQETTIHSLEMKYHSFNDEVERWEQQMFQRENELSQEVNRRLGEVVRELEKIDNQNTVFHKEILEKNNDQMEKLSADFDRVSLGFRELEEKNKKKEFVLSDFEVFVENARQMIYQHINNLKDFLDFQRQEGNRLFLDKFKQFELKASEMEKQVKKTEKKIDEVQQCFEQIDVNKKQFKEKVDRELRVLVGEQNQYSKAFLDEKMKSLVEEMNQKSEKEMNEMKVFLLDQKDVLNAEFSAFQEKIQENSAIVDELQRAKDDFDVQLNEDRKKYEMTINDYKKKLDQEFKKTKAWWEKDLAEKANSEKKAFVESFKQFLEKEKSSLNEFSNILVNESKSNVEKSIKQLLLVANKNVDDGKKEILKEVKDSKKIIALTLKEIVAEKNKILESGKKVIALENMLKSLEKEHEKNLKYSEKELEIIRDKVKKGINFKSLSEKVFSGLKDKSEKEMKALFHDFQGEFVVGLDTAKKEVEKLSHQSKRELNVFKKEIDETVEKEKSEIARLKEGFQRSIDRVLLDQTQLKNLVKSSKVDLENLLDSFKVRTRTIEEELLEVVNKRVLDVDKRVAEISKKIEKFFQETKVFGKVELLSNAMKVQVKDYEKKLKIAQQQNEAMDNMVKHFDRLLSKKKKVELLSKDLQDQRQVIMRLDAQGKQFISETQKIEEQMHLLENAKEQMNSFFDKSFEYEKSLKSLKKDLSDIDKKKEESAAAIAMINQWQERLNELSNDSAKILQKLTVGEKLENNIKDRLEKLDEKTIKLQENYKGLDDFHKKYEQLDYLVEDMDARMKSLEETRRKIILDRNAMLELREKFDDQIKIVLKHSFNGSIPETDIKKIDKGDLNTMISRLHAIGWSKKDIAKHLGLDSYDVELILKERKK